MKNIIIVALTALLGFSPLIQKLCLNLFLRKIRTLIPKVLNSIQRIIR